MATFYKNKFRNESTRLQKWDYRNDGAYFITICTSNREPHFGEIIEGKMCLSNIGVLADVFWNEIKNHAKNIKLDAFVVMPDHIHGILILEGNEIGTNDLNRNNIIVDEKRKLDFGVNDFNAESMVDPNVGTGYVGTGHALSLRRDNHNDHNDNHDHQGIQNQFTPNPKPIHKNIIDHSNPVDKTIGQQRFQNIGKNSVSSIIGSYKSAVTKHARRMGHQFSWQTRFYEHIIRDEQSLNRIRTYITDNPKMWEFKKK